MSTVQESITPISAIPAEADILEPSDDRIFKALLTHPNAGSALKNLISAVIERTVTEVQIRNNELPVTDDDEKNERLDVNCVVDGGDQVDVEMQASRRVELTDDKHISFINKSIYYLTDLHSSQKSKGVAYRDMVRTYQVTFCDHNVFETWPDFISRFSLRRDNGEQLSDQINIAVIELDKLNKLLNKPVEDMALIEEWSVFFKYAPDPKHRDLVNNVINKNGGIAMAATLLMEISKDEHERARIRSRKMAETDRISDLLTAEARGIEKGIEKGVEKGVEKSKIEIAKTMIADGMDVNTVSKYTKLTVDDILKYCK